MPYKYQQRLVLPPRYLGLDFTSIWQPHKTSKNDAVTIMSLGRGAGVNKPAWMTNEDYHQGSDTLTSSGGAAARRSRSRSRDRDDHHRSSRR
eukprot:scaffold143289_cov43-Cyclotella_meneghiniana.AAC.3